MSELSPPTTTDDTFIGADTNSWKRRISDWIPRQLVTRRLRGRSPRVLLTFDDGPSPAVTFSVLDRLAAYQARAIFFVIGKRIAAAPEVLSTITAAGHEVGNHTFYHQANDVLATEKASPFRDYVNDIGLCQQEVEKHIGLRPRWFRPPGGRLNVNSILAPRLLKLRTMTWRNEVQDWRFHTVEEARHGGAQLAQRAQPGDILLLHDERPVIIDLLDVLLPELKHRGFDLQCNLETL